jgi:hypothetical protein
MIAAIHEHFAVSCTIDHNEVIGKVAFLLTEFLAAAEGDRMGLAKRVTKDIVKAVPIVRAGGNYPGVGLLNDNFERVPPNDFGK